MAQQTAAVLCAGDLEHKTFLIPLATASNINKGKEKSEMKGNTNQEIKTHKPYLKNYHVSHR